jgi:hypothetical protein
MLTLIIAGEEVFNEAESTFETVNDVRIDFEHSLVSVSKWESKHQKPFLSSGVKSSEEIFDYLKAMVLTPDVDLDVL